MTAVPSFDLTGRVALVTGAARGLGHAISVALANAGADIALGLRDAKSDGGLADEISAMGRRVLKLQMDVTDLAQSQTAIDLVVAELGSLDILVNNVGAGVDKVALDVTEEDFDRVIAVTTKSAFFVSQMAARKMITAGRGGRIINMNSQFGIVAAPGEPLYCLAKGAITQMTRSLALEWGEYGINVNAICPTFFETPGTERLLKHDDFRADVENRIAALHRIGQPVEVAGAAVYLASPAAAMVTGHNLLVDGGWTAR